MAANLIKPDLTYTLPDTGIVMPQLAQDVCMVLFDGGAVLLALYAVYLSFNRKSWLPILFLIGGLFSVVLEPLGDVMGNAIHAPVGQDFAFQAEGHPIPWHVVFVYFWYFGAMNIALFDRFSQGNTTPAFWWKTAAFSAVLVAVVEQVPVYFGVWVYYGTHPFLIGVMPLAMIAANIACVIIPSLVIYRLMPILTGWKQLLVLAIVPVMSVAAHTGANIPSYITLGQDTANVPYWVLQAGSLLTVLFSFVIIWVGINLVFDRIPPNQHVIADA